MKKFGIGMAVVACAMLVFSAGAWGVNSVCRTRTFNINMASIFFDITWEKLNYNIGTEAEIEQGWKHFHLLNYDIDCTTSYKLSAEVINYSSMAGTTAFNLGSSMWATGPDSLGLVQFTTIDSGAAVDLVSAGRTSGNPGDKEQIWYQWDLTKGDYPTGLYDFQVRFIAYE